VGCGNFHAPDDPAGFGIPKERGIVK